MVSKKSILMVLLSICSVGMIEAQPAQTREECESGDGECFCACFCGHREMDDSTDTPHWDEKGKVNKHGQRVRCFCNRSHHQRFDGECKNKRVN